MPMKTKRKDTKQKNNLSPKLESIVGVVKLPKDFDEKKELILAIEKNIINI